MTKKVWKVVAGRTNEEGRFQGMETVKTILATATRALEYVEELKQEIEKQGQWWMGYAKGMENRPMVYAVEIEVEEI